MSAIHLSSEQNFEDLVKKEGISLIDFSATWCKPCSAVAPIFEQFAVENPDVACIKVDIDDHYELSSKYNVRSVPTFLVLKNGLEISRHVGVLNKTKMQLLAFGDFENDRGL